MIKSLFRGLAVAAFCLSESAEAQWAYNANVAVTVTGVFIYTDDTTILFPATPLPSIPNCSPTYFIVPPSVSAETRQMILTRLLTAYNTREKVNIGYDGQSCYDNNVRVFRVG